MCGSGCKCAKADLYVEPVISPGTAIEVTCALCQGHGTQREALCWRCNGLGKVQNLSVDKTCPACESSWTGEQIALDSMAFYGATHFGRSIGIYRFDQTVAYQCPDCGTYVSRYNPDKILTEAQALGGSLQELRS